MIFTIKRYRKRQNLRLWKKVFFYQMTPRFLLFFPNNLQNNIFGRYILKVCDLELILQLLHMSVTVARLSLPLTDQKVYLGAGGLPCFSFISASR